MAMKRQKKYTQNFDDEMDFVPMQKLPQSKFENTIEAQVQIGDTLQALALRFHCSVADIKRLNKIDKDNEIHARKVVKIPVTVHSVLLETLPSVHKSGNNSPKHQQSSEAGITRNPLENSILSEKLLVASVNSAGDTINDIILKSTVRNNAYNDDSIDGALLFFAVPIRIPAPETHIQKEFRNFIVNFNRTYHGNSTEYQRRYRIFKNTFEIIEDLRRQDVRPVFGINRFSDVSIDEFSQRYLSVERSHNMSHWRGTISTASLYRYKLNNFGVGPTPLPQSVDWRKRGIITPIRNQGECGSCYAHSVIANVEAMHALKWNSSAVDELSVQQMIDCAGNSKYDGCQGGDTCQLLQWLKNANITILPKRVYQQQQHQQVPSQNNVCRNTSIWPTTSQTVRVTDYTCLSFLGQEHEMLAFLAFKGPLIASVNALAWKQYVGGVIKGNCNGPLNHVVQIVGYDLGGYDYVEVPHFIVRNSWGTNFGYRGYAKIAIGGNVCGIAEEVSSVTVD